ncbi:hypothetical protein [Saccharothrix sp. ST-888]|uniref:hypothetical protein n=1 Tax=Saccharothrix sp. ST-888 TaxID=1427391 RepID=UPI0005ED3A8F|nr:hypothetical protein [Saccharothrix sp. ST-888]KJK58228.1 hypothetical protein UK12_11580 [Saccharothrix sp. ST-888]
MRKSALGSLRAVLGIEAVAVLWVTVVLAALGGLFGELEGSSPSRVARAVWAGAFLVWAGLCGWAAVAAVRPSRSRTGGWPRHLVAVAAGHSALTAVAALRGSWPTMTACLAVATLAFAVLRSNPANRR